MNELSLFSGAGGGLLASRMLGWTTIGYVEFNEYCQKIIAQRIKDGWLDEAPIFGNIEAFISEGYADSYQGVVDVISAGFPCQPFSVAGKQAAADDPRNMWPATIECIRRVRPRWCFLENVPGLLAGSHRYFGTILGELAESGFTARWRCLSADEMGADHRRDRVWVFAHSDSKRCFRSNTRFIAKSFIEETANSLDSPSARIERLEERLGESAIFGDPDDVAYRVDRLKAIGNGQVPQCAVMAYRLLSEMWRV